MDNGCTCVARPARSTDEVPPEVVRDRRCPVHGDKRYVDPDGARDDLLEREWDDADRDRDCSGGRADPVCAGGAFATDAAGAGLAEGIEAVSYDAAAEREWDR